MTTRLESSHQRGDRHPWDHRLQNGCLPLASRTGRGSLTTTAANQSTGPHSRSDQSQPDRPAATSRPLRSAAFPTAPTAVTKNWSLRSSSSAGRHTVQQPTHWPSAGCHFTQQFGSKTITARLTTEINYPAGTSPVSRRQSVSQSRRLRHATVTL